MLLGKSERQQSAWVTYFKGLMHAADARCCVESEIWIPAAVSLYYAVFDLTVATMLATIEYNILSKRENLRNVEDPFRLVEHQDAVDFARQNMPSGYADAIKELNKLRVYASYRPSIRIGEDGRTYVQTCEIGAIQFVHDVQRYATQLETIFAHFREHLSQLPDASTVILHIESEAETALQGLQGLGQYRNGRGVAIAEQLHFSIFSRARRAI